jgi:hypothetical protein
VGRIWYLNFSADETFSRVGGRREGKASARERHRFERLAGALRPMLRDDDIVLDVDGTHEGPAPSDAPRAGHAWLMTDHARAVLRRAGAEPVDAPPEAVLRAANSRRFSAMLGVELPGATFVETHDTLEQALRRATRPLLLSREHSFAGRGRMSYEGPSSLAGARRFAQESFAHREGIEITPRVDRTLDLSVHGHVTRAARVVLRGFVAQTCNGAGAWRGTENVLPGDARLEWQPPMMDAAEAAGYALARAGYFGPFGIDGFVYLEAGALRLCPRCEINARYTMGMAVSQGWRDVA